MSKIIAFALFFAAFMCFSSNMMTDDYALHILFVSNGLVLAFGGMVIMIIEAHRDDKRNMERKKRQEKEETLEEHEKHCEFCQAMKEYQEERNREKECARKEDCNPPKDVQGCDEDCPHYQKQKQCGQAQQPELHPHSTLEGLPSKMQDEIMKELHKQPTKKKV